MLFNDGINILLGYQACNYNEQPLVPFPNFMSPFLFHIFNSIVPLCSKILERHLCIQCTWLISLNDLNYLKLVCIKLNASTLSEY